MADILSNDELDTLLSAVDEGDVPVGSGDVQHRERNVADYDFRKPNRFSRDQLRVLQYTHKNAAQQMSSNLSSALRIGVEAQLVSIGQLTYEAFINSLADPICLNVVTLDPLEHRGVLTVDLPLAFAMMERMLGGPGETPETIRPLSQLEEGIVAQAVELVLVDLRECWQNVAPLALKVESRETSPGFVSVVPGPEIVLLITFSLGGQLASGEVKLCIPYVSIEPVMGKLGTEHMGIRDNQAGENDREFIETHLGEAPVEFSAMLGTTDISIGELLSLEAGHVIALDSKAEEPIRCEIEREVKFLASPGRVGRKNGVCIEQVAAGAQPQSPGKNQP